MYDIATMDATPRWDPCSSLNVIDLSEIPLRNSRKDDFEIGQSNVDSVNHARITKSETDLLEIQWNDPPLANF